MIDRLLARMDGGDPASGAGALRAFQTILVLVVATEYWTKGIRDRALMTPLDWAAVAAATLVAALVVHGRRRRAAFAGLALLQAVWVVQYFPLTGNHRYLELTLATLFAVLDDREADDRRLALRAVRWITVVVLFASGLQKFVHGYWFRGQFLAWSLWRDSFRSVLAPLFPADELARLGAYGSAAGDGPYLVSSPVVLALSNAVWIAQLGLAAMLVPRTTRSYAWVLAVGLVVVTEIVARELMFGVEFVAALTLFARTGLIRRLVVPVAIVLVLSIAMRLGVVPGVLFH